LLVMLQIHNFAQNPPIALKPTITISFDLGALERIYNPDKYQRGNMAISPDSRYFLGRLSKQELLLLDLTNAKGRPIPVTHNIAYAVFSKDSQRVALFGDVRDDRKTVTVLNLNTGEIVSTIRTQERIDQVSISPNGERVATGREESKLVRKGKNVVDLWDGKNGKHIARIDGCAGSIDATIFSPDSRSLLLDCDKLKDKPTKFLDARTGAEMASLSQQAKHGDYKFTPPGAPESIFSPNGTTIVSVYRFNGIRIWDVDSRQLRKEFVASQGDIHNITFTNDGRWFATNGYSPVIRMWDTLTGEKYRVFETDTTKSRSFFLRTVFSDSGGLLAGIDKRGRIAVWSTKNAGVRFVVNETAEKEDFSVNAFFGFGERVLFVRRENEIKLFNTGNGREIQTIPNPTGAYRLSTDGTKLFVLNSNNSISIWD
jgi:WD40 repeat protein